MDCSDDGGVSESVGWKRELCQRVLDGRGSCVIEFLDERGIPEKWVSWYQLLKERGMQ